MKRSSCEVLLRPEASELRFLPEGPYSNPDGRLSWVAIQHGADSETGSINLFNPCTGESDSFPVPGRPGFAFPTDVPGVFICGAERSLGLIDTATGDWTELAADIDSAVSNTVINDGVVYDGNLIFGCKDLEFATPKAGLYLWRAADRQLIQLKDDQLCSNGKAVTMQSDGLSLYDIDSPLKTITVSDLDISNGRVGAAKVVVDLTSEDIFPDGMILTPDHGSLIVALYNPNDADFGEARQYSIVDGQLEAVWECPGAAQVTCPQLLQTDSGIKLVLTTAIEHLPPERLKLQPNAGCLFVGYTDFDSIGDQPVFSTVGLVKADTTVR
jgi:sugar lactone lactonase YvrE